MAQTNTLIWRTLIRNLFQIIDYILRWYSRKYHRKALDFGQQLYCFCWERKWKDLRKSEACAIRISKCFNLKWISIAFGRMILILRIWNLNARFSYSYYTLRFSSFNRIIRGIFNDYIYSNKCSNFPGFVD